MLMPNRANWKYILFIDTSMNNMAITEIIAVEMAKIKARLLIEAISLICFSVLIY